MLVVGSAVECSVMVELFAASLIEAADLDLQWLVVVGRPWTRSLLNEWGCMGEDFGLDSPVQEALEWIASTGTSAVEVVLCFFDLLQRLVLATMLLKEEVGMPVA